MEDEWRNVWVDIGLTGKIDCSRVGKLMIDGCPTLHYPTLPLISAYHASPYPALPLLTFSCLARFWPCLAVSCPPLPLFALPRLCPSSLYPGFAPLQSTQALPLFAQPRPFHTSPRPAPPSASLSCFALRCHALPSAALPCLSSSYPAKHSLPCIAISRPVLSRLWPSSPGSALLCVQLPGLIPHCPALPYPTLPLLALPCLALTWFLSTTKYDSLNVQNFVDF